MTPRRHVTDDVVERPPFGFCDALINPANEVAAFVPETHGKRYQFAGFGRDKTAILSDESGAAFGAEELKVRCDCFKGARQSQPLDQALGAPHPQDLPSLP